MNAIAQPIVKPSFFEDWTAARKLLLPAMAHFHGFYEENDVIAGILAGQYRLWLWPDLAVVTDIFQTPRMKALRYFLIGGEMLKQWEEREAEIADYAQSIGCTRLMGGGRREWNAFAPKAGYTFDSVTYFKDL